MPTVPAYGDNLTTIAETGRETPVLGPNDRRRPSGRRWRDRWRTGDNAGSVATREQPAGEVVERVYAELKRVANGYLRRERTRGLQATDLVHEAYLRLQASDARPWQNRTHFVALAAIAMRRLLIERARARHAARRGGGRVQITLDDALLVGEDHPVDVLDVDRALTALAAVDERQARIVELRVFGGLSVEETAEAVDISPATVKRDWTVARAWLLRELARERP